jgi:hypothetical protein
MVVPFFYKGATVDNLWLIKTILKCFEIASYLRVNFAKSCVMGVNAGSTFFRSGRGFWGYMWGPTFEGLLPINQSRIFFSKYHGSWSNKFVSLGTTTKKTKLEREK